MSQVIDNPRQLPYCQVKCVSTAILESNSINGIPQLSVMGKSREILPSIAHTYIRYMISRLQQGTCANLFLLPQYTRDNHLTLKPNTEQSSSSEHSQPRTQSQSESYDGISGEEDWDLALDEIKGFTNEFGSDDESDARDLNLEMDVYGLNQDYM